MANPTQRHTAKVCAHCGAYYRPRTSNYQRQKYCGFPCSVNARTRMSRVLGGRKAAATKAATRPQRMTNARHQAYRRGYAEGWESCLRSLDPAYSTEMDKRVYDDRQ